MQKAIDSLTSKRKNLLSGTINDDVRIPGRLIRDLAVDGDLVEVQLRIKQVRVAKRSKINRQKQLEVERGKARARRPGPKIQARIE